MNYDFNLTDTDYITTATIAVSEPIKISTVTLNGINKNTADGYVQMTVTDGTSTYTERINIKNSSVFTRSGNAAVFITDFTTQQNVTVRISITGSSQLTVYGGAVNNDEKVMKGLGAYVSSENMFNCTIDAAPVEETWRTGSSGYPELYANEGVLWEDWERDENGYPLNRTVWRNDNKNNGYLYITEPAVAEAKNNSVLIFTADSLGYGQSFIFTDNELLPIKIAPLSILG